MLLNTISVALSVVIFFIVSRRAFPWLRPVLRWRGDMARRLTSFASLAFVSSISGTILFQLDKVVLGSLTSVALVTFYVIPGTLAQRIHSAAARLTAVIFPASSELMAQGDLPRVRTLYTRATRLLALFVLSLAVPQLVLSPKILRFWVGPEMAHKSGNVLRLLVLTYALLAITAVAYYVLMGSGQPGIPAAFTTAGALVNVGLLFALVPPYGITGAAVAYVVGVVPMLGVIWYTERRVLAIGKSTWPGLLLRLSPCAALQAAACFALGLLVSNLATLLATLVVTLPLAAVCYWLLGFVAREDRELFEAVLPRFRARFNP